MDKKLLKQLEKWHKNLDHEKIISAVLKIPTESRDVCGVLQSHA